MQMCCVWAVSYTHLIVRFSGTSENSLMFGIMIVGAGLSSVLSNTGTAACLMPVSYTHLFKSALRLGLEPRTL